MIIRNQSFHLPVDHWEIMLEQAKKAITEDPTKALQLQRIYDIISFHKDNINPLLEEKNNYSKCPHYSITFPSDLVSTVESLLPQNF